MNSIKSLPSALEERGLVRQAKLLEARLRVLHVKATGRALPCRLPHVLDEAHAQIKTRPDEVRLTTDDMTALLYSLLPALQLSRLAASGTLSAVSMVGYKALMSMANHGRHELLKRRIEFGAAISDGMC